MANVHEVALRTLARVTFTWGSVGSLAALSGCIEPGDDGEGGPDDAADSGESADGGAAFAPDLAVIDVPDGAGADGLWVITDEDGGLADGDFLADAVADAAGDGEAADALVDGDAPDAVVGECEHLVPDQEAWVKCCQDINWDFERDPSCTPWGPPVPPAMEV